MHGVCFIPCDRLIPRPEDLNVFVFIELLPNRNRPGGLIRDSRSRRRKEEKGKGGREKEKSSTFLLRKHRRHDCFACLNGVTIEK